MEKLTVWFKDHWKACLSILNAFITGSFFPGEYKPWEPYGNTSLNLIKLESFYKDIKQKWESQKSFKIAGFDFVNLWKLELLQNIKSERKIAQNSLCSHIIINIWTSQMFLDANTIPGSL